MARWRGGAAQNQEERPEFMNKHEIKKRYLFSVSLVGLVSRKTQIPLNFAKYK